MCFIFRRNIVDLKLFLTDIIRDHQFLSNDCSYIMVFFHFDSWIAWFSCINISNEKTISEAFVWESKSLLSSNIITKHEIFNSAVRFLLISEIFTERWDFYLSEACTEQRNFLMCSEIFWQITKSLLIKKANSKLSN